MLTNLIIGATYKVVKLHPDDVYKNEIFDVLNHTNDFKFKGKDKDGDFRMVYFVFGEGYPHLELIDTNGCTELSEQKCEVVNVPELKAS
jgi:hypothetical protein